MSRPNSPLIRLSARDNVAVAREAVPAGTVVDDGIITLDEIPSGHKIALEPIGMGQPVLKYGQVIGTASAPIEAGQHVHLQNLAMQDSEVDHAIGADSRETPLLPEAERATFQGYLRDNGKMGTRNYIAIISSVNCSATVCRAVADHFNNKGGLKDYPNVDGVVPITHGGGCALSTQHIGYDYLTRTLAGYAAHPNFAAVIMVGLGCETNQISLIKKRYDLNEGPTFRSFSLQEIGGTRRSVDHAIALINEMLPAANAVKRTKLPLSGITLALECGGSDGYSGISANPALGHAADLLVQNGGTAVLAETPEIYGAEHLLLRRAVSEAVGQKLLDRIEWWREYTSRNDMELNNNPSHGNKAGGLTTILEKSLGAVAKGGSMPMEAVYEYAEPIDKTGFVFMDTPGYDPVAVTGQIAGGCNMLVFTTGRGSCSGWKPVPTIKVATNSAMARHMDDDMDIDCGTIVEGSESIEEAGERIFRKIVAIASGEQSQSEIHDYGDFEFVPWHIGAVT